MKYFAKYLPVEGEIKKDDKIRWIINGNVQGEVVTASEDGTWPKKFSKVKLFLCSRDIQVGDRILCLRTAKTGDVELRTEGKYYDTCRFVYQNLDTWGYINNQGQEQYIHYPNEMCKVIGEISPEAIWVKEGDEFDEGDIRVLCIDTDDGDIPIPINEIKYIRAGAPYYLQVKGTCGHFH